MTEERTSAPEERQISSRQLTILTILGSTKLLNGLVTGWAAVLPKLQKDSGSFNVTENDVTWLASMDALSGIFTSFITGPLIEHLGPRRLLLLTILPMPFLWLLQAFVPALWVLYLGRAGVCVTQIMRVIVTPVLSSELSSVKLRSAAICNGETFYSIGILFAYLLVYFLSWDLTTAVFAVPSIIFILLMVFVPESPYWLIKNNKTDEAEKCLKHLHGSDADIPQEMSVIMKASKPEKLTLIKQIGQFKKRQNSRPVILLMMVFILRELGGRSAVFSYTIYVFRSVGVRLDAFGCAVLVGAVRVIFSAISSYAADTIGRKSLLSGVSLVAGVSLVITGVFLYVDVPGVSWWVPLVGVVLYASCYGIGFGTIPWVYVGEIIPSSAKSFGASIITICLYLSNFMLKNVFFSLISWLSIGMTFVGFGSINLILFYVVCCHLPETRGKTLLDIENIFARDERAKSKVLPASLPKGAMSNGEQKPGAEVVLDVRTLGQK